MLIPSANKLLNFVTVLLAYEGWRLFIDLRTYGKISRILRICLDGLILWVPCETTGLVLK